MESAAQLGGISMVDLWNALGLSDQFANVKGDIKDIDIRSSSGDTFNVVVKDSDGTERLLEIDTDLATMIAAGLKQARAKFGKSSTNR